MPHSRRLVEASDLKKAAGLLALAPAAWLLPPRAWPALTRPLSRLDSIFDARPGALPPGLLALISSDRIEAERRLRQSYVEDCMMTLRAWRRGGAPWTANLTGKEHLDAALSAGRGAIIWVAQTAGGALGTKMALWNAGYRMIHLSRPSHRFSGTRFGVRFLNPIQTGVESRYVGERVVMEDGRESAALLHARRRLGRGAIVSITAAGPAAESVTVSFFGGGLTLPAGALRLGLLTGAPVLPVFAIRTSPEAFDVCVEAPLPLDPAPGRAAACERAARAWAALLEARLREHPETWLGWLNPLSA
jgi:lauroyl/myristoyl acyltransferase